MKVSSGSRAGKCHVCVKDAASIKTDKQLFAPTQVFMLFFLLFFHFQEIC